MDNLITFIEVMYHLMFIFSNYAMCEIIVGNDRDKHNCIKSAGYTWCQALGMCVRPWEVGCPLIYDI